MLFLAVDVVSFLCPPFTVSNAAEATQNYAECGMGVLCGGDQLYAGVCPYTGGSYTGCKSVVFLCWDGDL